MSGWLVDEWHGCYKRGWGNELVPEAFKHPAKVSFLLAERIYDHMRAEGWLAPGDAVLDPFGGIAGFAYHALKLGLHWTGVELEQVFVDLGRANIDLWNRRYANHFARWGTARLLHGDSRNLLAVVGEQAAACVSSPPFGEAVKYGSPIVYNGDNINSRSYSPDNQGTSEGNLANLRATADGFAAAVSSPPYADGCRQEGNDHHPERLEGTPHAPARYDIAVSSPPYEHRSYEGMSKSFAEWREMQGRDNSKPGAQGVVQGYGRAEGQLAGSDTFWTAARAIVAQTYAALRPGGHAAWVTKRFVRNRQIVEFSQQWARLCESVGFRVVHWHKAMLVEDNGTQLAADGNHKRHVVKRASFFRRLAERKGSPAIDWEDVICMVKPEPAP